MAHHLVTDDHPPRGHRQPLGMQRAQIVRVRITTGTERADRGHLITVVERECCDGLARTGHFRAEPFVSSECVIHLF